MPELKLSPELELKANQILHQYLDGVKCYLEHIKSTKYQEAFLRRIEGEIDIVPGRVDDFRRMIFGFFGMAYCRGHTVSWDSNPSMRKAICNYLNLKPEWTVTPGKYRSIDDAWQPS